MTAEISWLIVLLLLAMGICAAWQHRQHLLTPGVAISALPQRHLRPHTPDHCPVCRQQAAGSTTHARVRPVVQPWREIKSRRGAPKRIPTDGFACPNRRCVYYHITDAQVHALVGDGVHGKYERIQTFRCQACTTTFSARRNTPLAPDQNLFVSSRPSADRLGGRAGCSGYWPGLRASACDHHRLAHPGRDA